MWYALLDMKNDVDSMTWLLTGTLQDIADAIIEQCEYNNPEEDGPFDFEQLDEDGDYYEADDYCALKEADVITPDLLKDFSFCLNDAEITLHCLAEGYPAFKEAFENYHGANFWLEEIYLPDHLEPDEEKAFADEFGDFLFDKEYMGDNSDKERKYISFKNDDE